MERYVELFGPFRFILIYAAVFSLLISAVCYVVLSFVVSGFATTSQIAVYGLMYYFIGLFVARQIVLNIK